MDFTSIIAPVFKALWYLIPALILIAVLKSPWFKGLLGEVIVNISTKLLLNKKTYHLIKNVTLPSGDGSTQIDHIIVSQYGIFVIETKNMEGWIFGDEKRKTWTQKIYKHSYKFQNPLHQNYKHVKTLEALLNIEPSKFFSVVVFIGNSTFKTEMPQNVTHGGEYIKYIKSKKQILLSEDEKNEAIYQIFQNKLINSRGMDKQHIEHVKQIVKNKT